MIRRTFGEQADNRDLVFIAGWGNRLDFETIRWLLDRLVGADYRVHAFQIPTVVTDFEAEYLDPIASAIADLEEYRLLAHSTGGLIGEFLDDPPPDQAVYLSPWWGFHDDLDNLLVDLAMRLPLSRPVLPAGIDREDLGVHTTDRQLAETPSRVAPTFLREAKRAQKRLPPFDEDSVVFYTPTDPIVSSGATEARTPRANRVRYDGGHELFGSACRDEYIDLVLAALESGVDAIPDD